MSYTPIWWKRWRAPGFAGPAESFATCHGLPPYVYSPIDTASIRLISLLPPDDLLPGVPRIQIWEGPHNVRKDDYEALSYCWGRSERNYPVCCDGRIIWVTQNLYNFLLRIRLDDQPREIWVDAISINQNDVTERNQQVRMMGDIYRYAKRVLIWLGPAERKSELLGAFIPRVLKVRRLIDPDDELEWDDDLTSVPPQLVEESVSAVFGAESIAEERAALQAIIDRDWWDRIWIIQEFFLAREARFLCGEWEFSWDELSRVLYFTDNFPGDVAMPLFPKIRVGQFNSLLVMKTAHAWREERLSLGGIALFARQAKASEAKDHIYALLSLAKDSDQILVDYRQDTLRVFEDATRRTLLEKPTSHTRGHPIQILEHAGISNHAEAGWPSWVLDWRCPVKSLALSASALAKATNKSKYTSVLDGQRLQLMGYELDSVSKVGPAAIPLPIETSNHFWVHEQMLMAYGAWLPVRKTLGSIYEPTGEATVDVFEQVVFGPRENSIRPRCAGFGGHATSIRLLEKIISWTQLPIEWLAARLIVYVIFCQLSIPILIRLWLSGESLSEIHHRRAYGRKVFRTRKGYLGLGSSDVRAGDSIWLLKGLDHPFGLRKAKGSHEYILIGDCYLHGHMNGESWQEENCNPIWLV